MSSSSSGGVQQRAPPGSGEADTSPLIPLEYADAPNQRFYAVSGGQLAGIIGHGHVLIHGLSLGLPFRPPAILQALPVPRRLSHSFEYKHIDNADISPPQVGLL